MLTFDKSTKRRKDENGFLHVDGSHISKEIVNPYMGNEIPGWQELGLIPDKLYQCYRKGSELKAGAESFNGLPILWGHKAESADAPQKNDRIGSMGTDAKFTKPYLDNSLIFTDKKAIDAIEKNERVELSSSYRWKPVIQAGKFGEQVYDIIMTKIRGNHLGLVEEGRAGGDVLVHDEKLEGDEVAKDTDPEIEKKESVIMGKIQALINSFKTLHKAEGEVMKKEDENAMDSEGMKKAFDNMSEDGKEEFLKMIGKKKDEKKADDEEKKPATDEEKEKAKDEEEAKKKADDEEEKKKADDEAEEKAKDTEKANDAAVAKVKVHYKALTDAAEDVRGVVGKLDALSYDSASDIYKKALELQKVDTTGFEPSAYSAMFSVHKKNLGAKSPVLAQDSKTELSGPFAGLKNVKI